MCFFSKTISSLHYLWPVCSGTQIGGWNAKPQLSVSSSQPSRRNPLTTPLASRSLHHLSLLGITEWSGYTCSIFKFGSL